jgi:hypothetical protein
MTTTTEFDVFLRSIIETLELLDLPYMIGGSVASSIYGEARSTRDVDVSVVLPLEQVGDFVRSFQSLGYHVFADAIVDAVITGQPFNIIDAQSGYKCDIFLVDPQDPTPLEQQALQRRRYQIYDEASGAQAALYSPEDVIIYKLKYYVEGRMPKHLRDIGAMLFVQGEALDYSYITDWAERIGAADVWTEVLAEYRRRANRVV